MDTSFTLLKDLSSEEEWDSQLKFQENPFFIAKKIHLEEFTGWIFKTCNISKQIRVITETPFSLHSAIKAKNLACARFLIEHGVNINEKTKDGFAPIHFAAAANAVDILNLLKERGADFSALTPSGSSVICVAAINRHIPVLAYLLPMKSFFDSLNLPIPPLFIAAFPEIIPNLEKVTPFIPGVAPGNSLSAVEFLLTNGISVNEEKPSGYTALMHAMCYPHKLPLIRLLLSYKADKTVVSPKGVDLYEMAVRHHFMDYAELIGPLDHSEIIIALKKIAHAAHLKGFITLSDGTSRPLEGFLHFSFYADWTELLSTDPILTHEQQRLLRDAFSFAANIQLSSIDDILEMIYSNQITIIPIRLADDKHPLVGHSCVLVFYQNFMIFCDTGSGIVYTHRICNKKIKKSTIQLLRSPRLLFSDFCNIYRALTIELSPGEEKKPLYIPEFSSPFILLKSQKAPNCSYTSTTAALEIALRVFRVCNPYFKSKYLKAKFLETALQNQEALVKDKGIPLTPSMLEVIAQAKAKLIKWNFSLFKSGSRLQDLGKELL